MFSSGVKIMGVFRAFAGYFKTGVRSVELSIKSWKLYPTPKAMSRNVGNFYAI